MKKTAEAGKQPFDVRVGVGFAQFRGMRTVMDAVNTPPNFWRYLQNVRLGRDGIESRPGLVSFDSPGQTVLGFAELAEQTQSATIYFGPYPFWAEGPYDGSTDLQAMAYARTDLSLIPDAIDLGDPAAGLNVIEAGAAFIFANRHVAAPGDTYLAGPLSPCGLAPYIEATAAGWARHSVTGGIDAAFFQAPQCLDPIVLWNGRWLAAGAYRGDFWSGVGDFEPARYTTPGAGTVAPAAGDPVKGGQAVVEVNFTTQATFDRVASLGYGSDPGFGPGGLTKGFAGGVTEVFRLPGPGYKFGVRDAMTTYAPFGTEPAIAVSHFPAARILRSMAVVKERNDDPFTAAVETRDVLYLGTAGGNVVAIARIGPAGTVGFNDPTSGEVYSWDGTTLRLEVATAGQACVVTATPDGGVLAAGAMSAAFKSEKGAAWAPVTYAPTPTVQAAGATGYNDDIKGYFWTDRCIYAGDVFLIGIDRGAGVLGPGFTNTPAQLVLARFNRATLTISIIRTGAAFAQVAGNNFAFAGIEQPLGSSPYPSLATDGGTLYYLTHWIVAAVQRAYVGTYDGASFDDDAVPLVNLVTALPQAKVNKLLAAGGAVWAVEGTMIYRVSPGSYVQLTAGGTARAGELVFVGP